MTPKEIAKELNRILAREVYAADAFAVAMRRLADRIEAEEDVFAPNTTLPEDWRAHIRTLRARAEKAEGERLSAWDECKRLEGQVRVARVERVKAEARVAELASACGMAYGAMLRLNPNTRLHVQPELCALRDALAEHLGKSLEETQDAHEDAAQRSGQLPGQGWGRVAELTEIIRDAFDKATASRYTDSANVVMECLQ